VRPLPASPASYNNLKEEIGERMEHGGNAIKKGLANINDGNKDLNDQVKVSNNQTLGGTAAVKLGTSFNKGVGIEVEVMMKALKEKATPEFILSEKIAP